MFVHPCPPAHAAKKQFYRVKLSEKYLRATVGRAVRQSRNCQFKAVRGEGKDGTVNIM